MNTGCLQIAEARGILRDLSPICVRESRSDGEENLVVHSSH